MILKKHIVQNVDKCQDKNESGRSMVDMLGVLAIMGILAVGGISGYRFAMDKYRAASLITEVGKRAVVYSQQRLMGRELSDEEFQDDRVAGYDFEHGLVTDKAAFFIMPKQVSALVCRQIAGDSWQLPYDIKIGRPETDQVELSAANCLAAGEDSLLDLTFYFADDLGSEPNESVIPGTSCSVSAECSDYGCSYCRNGVCLEGCDRYYVCSQEQRICLLSCPEGMIESGGTCICDSEQGWVSDASGGCVCPEGKHCCPPNHFWRESIQACQDWDTCWQHSGTGMETWEDDYFLTCQEGCPEGQYYAYDGFRYIDDCEGPTRKGKCVDLDDSGYMGRVRTPVYNQNYDQKGMNNLGTGSLIGEEEALRLTENMIVSENIGIWFYSKTWCLGRGGRMATKRDVGCDQDNLGRCSGSRVMQALMSLYGAQPTGKDAMYLLDSPDGVCQAYHIWTEDGTLSLLYNRGRGAAAALCIVN